MKWKLFSRSKVEVAEPEAPAKTPGDLIAGRTQALRERMNRPVAEPATTEERLKAMTYKELQQEFRDLCWREKRLEREARMAERMPPASNTSKRSPYQGRGFRSYVLHKDMGYVWAEMETRPEHAKRSWFKRRST